jgi:hypothetical protein
MVKTKKYVLLYLITKIIAVAERFLTDELANPL